MTCFVLLGKTGDILNGLCVIHHWFKTNNEKPVLMVAKQYAGLLQRVPYVTPLVYDGDWTDLKGALTMAKQKFSSVHCLSTYGKDFPIEHRTSSFVLEPYERMGWLSLYDTLPLVISHAECGSFDNPTILFADHSQSSPFLHKQELYAMLMDEFPGHKIIRLSDVVLPHFADSVNWYNQADALVTVETAHLHLSAATKTPVFALATVNPSRWNGSAWSKRFSYYMRYSEFDQRKMELVEAIKNKLAGVRQPEVMVLN